jgi:hypothetical protein
VNAATTGQLLTAGLKLMVTEAPTDAALEEGPITDAAANEPPPRQVAPVLGVD